MRLEDQLDIPDKNIRDPEGIEKRLPYFEDSEVETVYHGIKSKVMENVDSAKNHDDPRKVKLPSPIKSLRCTLMVRLRFRLSWQGIALHP